MRLLVIGGSDAGISAGLRARQLDPSVEVSLLVADGYPNFSICGLPYYLSGDVPDWRDLAHRTAADLEAAGLELLVDHTARAINPAASRSGSPTRPAPTASSAMTGWSSPPARCRSARRSTASTCPGCMCCTGADLKAELLALAAREGVRAGWVLTFVGSLSRVRLRMAGGAEHGTWQARSRSSRSPVPCRRTAATCTWRWPTPGPHLRRPPGRGLHRADHR